MKEKKKHALNLVFSILLLILFCVLLAAVMLWEHSAPAQPTQPQTLASEPAASSAPPSSAPETTSPPETTLPAYTPRRINFLLIGQDRLDETEQGRSDTMLLCSFDTGANTVTMISFLRDIYLKIPGYSSNRLNASYAWGGSELLNETLEENFGVQVDVNLEIDFEGFQILIDDLGGVDLELTSEEASHLNKNYGWDLTEGANHLDGSQALAYARIRRLDSDFVRTQRQRNVLTALMHRFRTASLQEILNATDVFLEQSTSDHSDEELLNLALELYPLLSDCELITQQIPADGTYTYETIRGMSVIEVDLEDNREILHRLLKDVPS